MEGRTEPRKGVSLLLVLVMTFSLLPGVQAQSGEVLLDAESFSVDDYASFEGASLPFTVELHEQSGATADVNLTLLVNTLEGTLLSSTTQTVGEMTPLEERNVSAVFENLPFGFSEVTVLLEGDVGANTSTHMVSLSRTVQLEVKADNTNAQRFYTRRGMTVRQELHGYYQSGLGFMMRGPLEPPTN